MGESDLEKSRETSERITGNRKFIVTSDGLVHVGNPDESHPDLARRMGLSAGNIRGGGVVTGDRARPIAHGYSGTFGTYDKSVVEKARPEWEVLTSERVAPMHE
ncbi:MAG: hypothetical protein RIQ56_915 [Candidatus Parcubacteria bacterium]|jgi:hypothetical protein